MSRGRSKCIAKVNTNPVSKRKLPPTSHFNLLNKSPMFQLADEILCLKDELVDIRNADFDITEVGPKAMENKLNGIFDAFPPKFLLKVCRLYRKA